MQKAYADMDGGELGEVVIIDDSFPDDPCDEDPFDCSCSDYSDGNPDCGGMEEPDPCEEAADDCDCSIYAGQTRKSAGSEEERKKGQENKKKSHTILMKLQTHV